jgi:flavodoxin I
VKPIGVFFGSSTGNCETIAVMIKKKLHNYYVEVHDILETEPSKISEYDNLIFGVSTWGVGEFQEDWKDFVEKIDHDFLKNKVIALYGLGDQDTYSESFCDGLGVLYERIKGMDCKIIGSWPIDGYDFESSKATVNGSFVGLAIDEDTQPELTQERVNKWLEDIVGMFV